MGDYDDCDNGCDIDLVRIYYGIASATLAFCSRLQHFIATNVTGATTEDHHPTTGHSGVTATTHAT